MAPALTAITDSVHFAYTDLVNWTLVTDANGAMLIDTVRSYIALRRAAGFGMANVEPLLVDFAHYAHARGDVVVRAETAISWASRGRSPERRAPPCRAPARRRGGAGGRPAGRSSRTREGRHSRQVGAGARRARGWPAP